MAAVDPISQTACPIPLRITAVRSDSIDIRLRLMNAATHRPIVLTGWGAEAEIWASSNIEAPSHEFAVAVDQSPAGQPGTGMVTITAEAGETVLWLVDAYWSLVMTGDGVRKTIAAGPWQMTGKGLPPSSVPCGLCPAGPEVEQAGAVTARGYHELWLPYPQTNCSC